MPAGRSSRPGALVEGDRPTTPPSDGDRARHVAGLAEQAHTPDTTPELQPPAGLTAALEAGDRQVQRIGTLTAVPRIKDRADAKAADASALTRLLDQLVDVRAAADRPEPVPPQLVLQLGTTWRLWLQARGIEEAQPDPAGAV